MKYLFLKLKKKIIINVQEIKKDKVNKLGFKESCFIAKDSIDVIQQVMNSAFQIMEKPFY